MFRQQRPCENVVEPIDGFLAQCTIADKSYDANYLIDKIVGMQAAVVISLKRNRKDQRPFDVDLYRERNVIARFFSKLKQLRRVATR